VGKEEEFRNVERGAMQIISIATEFEMSIRSTARGDCNTF